MALIPTKRKEVWMAIVRNHVEGEEKDSKKRKRKKTKRRKKEESEKEETKDG